MKLSKDTLDILENFATINNSVVFKKGTDQKTVSPQKTILAQSTFKESFPRDFAIYDLTQFLSIHALFNDPTIDCGEKALTIKDDHSKTTYYYAAPENITAPSDKKITLPSVDAEFTVSAEALKKVLEAAGVLGLPEVYVSGRDGQAYIGANNSRVDASNIFEYKVGVASANFNMTFKLENLKLMKKSYAVKLCNKGIAHFAALATNEKGEAAPGNIEYWIPVDAGTTKKK